MFYLYVLQNQKNTFYIGSTPDLRRRLKEHNQGKCIVTRGKKWRVVYYEAYLTEAAVRYRESRLKNHGRSKQLLFERIQHFLD